MCLEDHRAELPGDDRRCGERPDLRHWMRRLRLGSQHGVHREIDQYQRTGGKLRSVERTHQRDVISADPKPENPRVMPARKAQPIASGRRGSAMTVPRASLVEEIGQQEGSGVESRPYVLCGRGETSLSMSSNLAVVMPGRYIPRT